jgi:hypothetical protein
MRKIRDGTKKISSSGVPLMTFPPVEETAPGADINTTTGANGLLVVCKTDAFVEFQDRRLRRVL